MKPLSRLLVALCLSPLLAQAAPLTQVTLPDGRQVQLNDDFTWEYLLIKPTASGEVVTGAVAVPVLTEQAMTNPDLLAQAVKDGISVKLDKIEGSDPLSLQFLVSNTGSRSVVRVRGSVTLFSEQGAQLVKQEARFWVGENRLPESYLRKGQQRPSLVLEMPRPAGLTGKPLVRVEIEEVEFR
ncbi:hypothetical protein A9R10_08535 [Aeromonas piscicola]|jgi:hypothetical protein|uniref:DUF3157 family protein n=1 Tax=Aeromonas TaxID=642 RepID=UPI0008085B16|nr:MULTISPECIES: DUF3157 family protein [Aeromonas]MCH7347760.1 DUF3157 family protein [Aeromonas sp. MR7]MCW0504547.1 DUF3157 family protein [Aeromonas piscicola]MDM5087521.1 DUF3157 family protein [Aeromonas bestiarum]OCA62904.1 hypothetical protein A9R10_08535 [Aeromonas piscicola]